MWVIDPPSWILLWPPLLELAYQDGGEVFDWALRCDIKDLRKNMRQRQKPVRPKGISAAKPAVGLFPAAFLATEHLALLG